MKWNRGVVIGAAVVLGAVLGIAGCRTSTAQAQGRPQVDPAQASRRDALSAAGTNAALTIYPVHVLGAADRNVADVLGLVLESMGMDNLDATDAAFARPMDVPWDQAPAQFAEYLKTNPPATGYALYAEYLGEPRGGPTEVRFLVTDAAGNLVLSDRQTPADADFKRTAARDPDPMGCSVLVGKRLFSLLDWKHRRGGEPAGKFAKLWEQKSGTPDKAERAAMEQRSAALQADLKSARFSVYPTLIGGEFSAESAQRLAKLVAQELGCQAAAASEPLSIQLAPSSNEPKRLWDLARALRERLRAAPAPTDYAVLAEYYINPKGGPAGAVHVVVCDKSGEWVLVDFQNNQHADFQRVAPKSVEDCDRLAAERLRGRLK